MTSSRPSSRLVRRFVLIAIAGAIIIPLVAGIGLRLVVRSFVLSEAEKAAIHISTALRDCKMQPFIPLTSRGNPMFAIPQEDIAELDKELRAFLAPLNIVKIKVFDANTKIIYSTDPTIIGRLDPDNAKLRTALNGAPVSKHESKDAVWDLADEERSNVEIVETYVPVRGPGGKVVGSFEVYTDITHHLATADTVFVEASIVVFVTVLVVFAALVLTMRRAAQRLNASTAALCKSEEKFRTLVDNQPGAVYRCACDADWTMEYLSDGIYDMCGYPASDFIDNNVRSYASIIHPDDIQLVNDAVQDGVRKKQPYVIEYRVIDVDGNERWCYEKGRGVFDDDGELRWLDGAIFDTTERKQAEEDLRLFRTLVDHSDDAVFMIEMETGRFIDVNKRACVNLGYAQDELLAMHVEEIEATIPGQCSWQERTRQVRRQGMLTIEGRHVRRDGTLFPVEVNIRYVRDKNKDYLVAVARDITERERAEAERHHLETRIREAERMESLGVMAGGIAHDFNNLLTGVLGNVELVLADVPEGSSKRESLEDIQKCATRAAELTYQMLAYSGKDLFVAETVNVNSLIRRMMPVARAAVPDGIDLTIDLAGNVAAINAGPAQIRQVVTVLLTNAAEAIGDEEGAISITTAAVHIGPAAAAGGRSESAPDGDYVVIKVADTGAGMDEDTLARAFDPFFTTKFTGRGLGLSAAQGIVHGHNGAISIESEPGKGTTVRVLLPLLTEPATAEPVSIG